MAKKNNKKSCYVEKLNCVANDLNSKANSIFEIITKIYIIFVLTFYLLFVGAGGYEGIGMSKYWMFIISSSIYVASIILVTIELIIIGRIKLGNIIDGFKNLSWSQKLILLYLLFTIVSSVLSEYRETVLFGGKRLEGLYTIALYCFIFLFVSKFSRKSESYVFIFGISMTVFCVISIIQLMGYNPFNMYPERCNYYDGNIKYTDHYIGTIGNVGFASALMCFAIPMFTVGIIKYKTKIKFLLLFPLILCIIVLFAIKVLAGIVGVVVGLFLILPFIIGVRPKIRRIIYIAIVFLIILAIIFLKMYDVTRIGMLHEVHEILNGNVDDKYGTGRIYIWKNVLNLVPERLLLGGGPDTLSKRLTTYFERYDENLGITIYAFIDSAHNEYLNILVNQGLLALLCYIMVIVFIFVGYMKRNEDNVALIFTSAILCYCVQAFFGIGMYIISVFFWVFLGILENKTIDGGKNEK